MPPKNRTRRYAVFLSYRHADNKEPGRQWATWLHQLLENYEIPSDLVGTTNSSGEVIPASLYPVFRDEEELPADADLTRNIREALENSALLVVICSPRAVQSRFVAEEIRYFKELGKTDRILALMIDGEPNAAEDSAKQIDGFTAAMECLPEPLRRGVAANDGSIDWNTRTEPIAADARPRGQAVQGWTNIAAYREQLLREGRTEKSYLDSEIQSYEQRLELTKLKMVAGALGVPLGVLTQRDKAMQLEKARGRARTLRRWLAAVGLLAVLSIGGGAVAWKKQQEAAFERDAKEQARIEEAKQRTLAQEQSERRRQLLVEAARSDRLVAEEKLGRGESPAAFAYLARSITYDATSTFAAEQAVAALNTWSFPTLKAFCQHNIYAYDARFSPDSKRVLICGPFREGEGAAVWGMDLESLSSARLLTTLPNVSGTDVRMSPDGKFLFVVSNDNTVTLREAESGKITATLPGHVRSGGVSYMQFSPHGELVFIALDKALIWSTQDGRVSILHELPASVVHVSFSPDCKRLLASCEDHTVRLVDSQTGKLVRTFAGETRAEFSRDGNRLITSSSDGAVRIWAASTGTAVTTLKCEEGKVLAAQFSPNSRFIAATCGSDPDEENPVVRTQTWDARDGKRLATSDLHDSGTWEFSPDGEFFVTAGGKHVEDRSARVWETQTGKLRATLQGHRSWVHTMHFSPDSQSIVTLSDDDTTRIFDLKSTELAIYLVEDASWKLWPKYSRQIWAKFSPDGKRVVTSEDVSGSSTWQRSVRVWDAQSGKRLLTLMDHQAMPSNTLFSPMLFSPDGSRVLTAADKIAQVWDAHDGKPLTAHAGVQTLTDMRFSPDGGRVVTAESGDFTTAEGEAVQVWDAQSGNVILTLEDKRIGAQFSPDGHRILTHGNGNAQIWDADQGRPLFALDSDTPDVNDVAAVAVFSRDSKRIAIGWGNRTATISEAATGKRISTIEGLNKYFDNLVFTQDGKRLVTSGGEVRVSETETGKLLLKLDGTGPASFSQDEQRIATCDDAVNICEPKTGKITARLRHDTSVRSVEFSKDNQHILTTADDGVARVWTILQADAGSPPPWFTDFLHYMAQQRLNSEGELEPIPPAAWLALRDRLRQVLRETAAQDTPYLRILRQFVSGN